MPKTGYSLANIMPRTQSPNVAEFIAPLNMNGLQGRMLVAPPVKNKKREILLVYGHHAILERWWGLVENLREYGTVTMPDLPGFGGMQSFRKIGKPPTIDNYADYLAAFVRMRYKRRRITIIGISFGFVVATRMLQRYPDLAKKVDLVVSMVGFMHHDDFRFKPRNRQLMILFSGFISLRPVAWFFRYVCLNGPAIKAVYARLPAGKRRLSTMDPVEAREMLDFDVTLWHLNDVHTHWRTTYEFLNIDNCRKQIALPVWHVGSNNDHYFDNAIVEQHMLVVFNSCTMLLIDAKAHTPSVTGGKAELAIMLPA
jgi:pimeloyl-ACP methyl ester carboxylesterase